MFYENKAGCADEYPYTENISLQYYPLVNSDSSTLFRISHDTNLSSIWTSNITASAIRDLSSSLSVNGTRLASDASKFNISHTAMESSVLTQVIDFRYNCSDEGFYLLSLYFYHPYSVIHRLHDRRCWGHYNYAELYLNLYPISFVIFPFILTTYSECMLKIQLLYIC